MGTLFLLSLILLSCISSTPIISNAQSIKSARLLDLLIRDYTFKSLDKHLRTGKLHSIHLPANYSDIRVDTARFRCGSLRRYGAKLKEFHLGIGVNVNPCIERVMLIRQNLGYNWSSIYYSNYNLSGYQIVSPILGLLAYNAGTDLSGSNPFEVDIISQEKPIQVYFSFAHANTKGSTRGGEKTIPLCASFEGNGKMTLTNPVSVSPHVCAVRRNGHFGLVIEAPPSPPTQLRRRNKINQWKVAVGSTVGTALGAFLLGLLLVAMFVKVKKRSRMEELERRAYEEEALQVSMVGHIRAPTANVTRTPPIIEHGYIPPPH